MADDMRNDLGYFFDYFPPGAARGCCYWVTRRAAARLLYIALIWVFFYISTLYILFKLKVYKYVFIISCEGGSKGLKISYIQRSY